MAQFLKDEVKTRLATAALEVFAAHGYGRATVAQIARAAGVSAGNVYRYYEDKDTLFYDVVPETLVRKLRAALRARVRAVRGVRDVAALGAGSAYAQASEALFTLTLANRLAVVIVLGRAEGSRYEGVRAEVEAELVALAIDHAASLSPPREITRSMRFALERLYEGFVAAVVAILAGHAREDEIREALADYGRYHLSGLAGFFS